ncbi:MAG: S-methyl-5'-thioadenosine phosphorylase [Limnochordales bacterium]|nr:S-methyl-5'-thioadenosine phosphorylase [Limnochordales bacterium]
MVPDAPFADARADRTAEAVAIIGGSGVYDLEGFESEGPVRVETPYGAVEVFAGRLAGRPVYFLPRHGTGHALPPHRVNYRGNIWALRELGVTQVLATNAVGSLRYDLRPGRLVAVDQFLDFTRGRPGTFFDGSDGRVVHTDLTEPYCPRLRALIVAAARALDLDVEEKGCYVCAEGPRYETAAEIRFFRQAGGDVVGMTGVPETVLAREAGLCYAAVALVTNMGAGMEPVTLRHEDVVSRMQEGAGALRQLLTRVVALLPATRPRDGCPCTRA